MPAFQLRQHRFHLLRVGMHDRGDDLVFGLEVVVLEFRSLTPVAPVIFGAFVVLFGVSS